jgi:integrase
MGPKVWFRFGGVPVPWRPLPAATAARRLPEAGRTDGAQRALLLAPIGSGLRLAELLRLRVGDIGSLDAEGRLLAEIDAEPLAVRYEPRRGKATERITFLSFSARAAVVDHLRGREHDGQSVTADAPLIAGPDGAPPSRSAVAAARERANGIIRAGSNINVDLCRTTGEFFREWGLPGSRFNPTDDPMATSTTSITSTTRQGGEPA